MKIQVDQAAMRTAIESFQVHASPEDVTGAGSYEEHLLISIIEEAFRDAKTPDGETVEIIIPRQGFKF